MHRVGRLLGMATCFVALASCFGGKANPQEVKATQDGIQSVRAEVDALNAQLNQLRGPSDAALQRVAAGQAGVHLPGGDAAALEVTWSSVHAGTRLNGKLVPKGNGEHSAAGIQMHRSAP